MRKTPAVFLGLMMLAATPLQGQIAWDGPLLVSPDTPPGWGIFLVDPEYSGIGFLTTWRGGGDLGFRVGLAEDGGEDLAVYGGVDYSRLILGAGNDFPLNISWVTGAGVGVGEDALISFPLGLTIGRAFQSEGVMFNPSIAPRMVLDAWFGDDRGPGDNDDDDLNLGLVLDFGFDIGFDPGWAIRFGVSGGDRDALAIGISFQI